MNDGTADLFAAQQLHQHKTLIHALLCSPEGKCDRPDCTAEVHKMKQKLKSMEAHAASCKIGANLPGSSRRRHSGGGARMGACQTCTRWFQLQKLRERFTRQLLQASKGQKTRKMKAADASGRPPLLKRSVTYIVNSFDDDDGEDDDGIDLDLLPSLVEGELEEKKRRREAKKGGRDGGDASSDELSDDEDGSYDCAIDNYDEFVCFMEAAQAASNEDGDLLAKAGMATKEGVPCQLSEEEVTALRTTIAAGVERKNAPPQQPQQQ